MEKTKLIECKKKISIIEIFIPIFYILNQYKVGNVSLGLIAMLFVILWTIFKTHRLCVPSPLLVLFGFMLLHDFIKVFIVSPNIFTWIERSIYLLFLSLIIRNVDRDNLYKVWKFVGIVAVIGLFYQSYQVYILGQPVSMIKIIPFGTSESANYLHEYMRPHSFFLEPAAYATWILPLLYMVMARGKIFFAMLISISVMLSTSSTGLIMVGIIWLYFSFINVNEKGHRRNGLILVSVFIIGIGAFTSLGIFDASLEKITNISLNNTSNSTRLILGFQLFAHAPMEYKIMGIPFDSVEAYLKSGVVNLSIYGLSLSTSYLGFVNAIGNCLLMYGIFGAFFYLRLFYKYFLRADKSLKCYVLLCFLAILGQSVFWNSLFVTQMAVILGCMEKPECKVIVLGKKGY